MAGAGWPLQTPRSELLGSPTIGDNDIHGNDAHTGGKDLLMARTPASNASPPSGGRTVKPGNSSGAPEEAASPRWAQEGDILTTAQRVPVDDTDNSLRGGLRGSDAVWSNGWIVNA
jgi:hypothetical protein